MDLDWGHLLTQLQVIGFWVLAGFMLIVTMVMKGIFTPFVRARLTGQDIVFRHIGNGRVVPETQPKNKIDKVMEDKDEGGSDWNMSNPAYNILPNNTRFTHVHPNYSRNLNVDYLLSDNRMGKSMDAKTVYKKILTKAQARSQKTQDDQKNMMMMMIAAGFILAVAISAILVYDHMGAPARTVEIIKEVATTTTTLIGRNAIT